MQRSPAHRVLVISDQQMAEMRFPELEIPQLLREAGFRVSHNSRLIGREYNLEDHWEVVFDLRSAARIFRQWDTPRPD